MSTATDTFQVLFRFLKISPPVSYQITTTHLKFRLSLFQTVRLGKRKKNPTVGKAGDSSFDIVITGLQNQSYVIFTSERESFADEANL